PTRAARGARSRWTASAGAGCRSGPRPRARPGRGRGCGSIPGAAPSSSGAAPSASAAPASVRRGVTRAWIAGLLAVAALALALRAPVAALPFERDEGEYAYLAWRWGEGEVPYRDAFDQKPPGVFALFALGLAFGETPAAVRWTAQALLLLA